MGNIKLDIAKKRRKILSRVDLGIPNGKHVVVIGSMRKGEEKLFLKLIKRVRERVKDVFFVVAPRHPERLKGNTLQEVNPDMETPIYIFHPVMLTFNTRYGSDGSEDRSPKGLGKRFRAESKNNQT